MKRIMAKRIELFDYEPALQAPNFYHSRVLNDLPALLQVADVIIASRKTADLAPVIHKQYSFCLFHSEQ